MAQSEHAAGGDTCGSHLGNSSTNFRIGLASPEDLDDEALAALQRAYRANT